MALKGNQNDIAQREHDLLNEAQRVIGVDPFGGITTDGNLEVRFASPYIGQAQIGTATSVAEWQIMKVTSSGVSFADNTDEFIKEWDERGSYTYTI